MTSSLRRAGLILLALALLAPAFLNTTAFGQQWRHADESKTNQSMFRPILELPDPNVYRNAAGAPGQAH